MHRRSARLSAACFNRFTATALTASLLALLAALPASEASASSAEGAGTRAASGLISPAAALPSYELGSLLSNEQLEQLLSSLSVGELGSGAISPEALAEALSKLPALQSLEISNLQGALQSALEGLGPETSLQEALENPAVLVPTITSTIEGLMSPLELSLLEGLLGKSVSSSLEEALTKVNATEVVSQLLGSAASPSEALEQLLSLLPAPILESLLGSTSAGGPVTEETVEQLAESLGMTTGELASALGLTTEDLAPAGTALLAPLTSGETLTTVTNTAGNLVASTLKTLAPEGGSGSEGGSGEGGAGGEGSGEGAGGSGSGGSGAGGEGGSSTSGPGGSGSGGSTATSSGTTVVVNVPSSSTSTNAGKKHGSVTGSIRILRHHVTGNTARLLLSAPGAGKIVLRHKGVMTVRRHVGKARHLSMLVTLSKAGKASARHHRRHGKAALRLRLKVLFVPRHGKRSHASVTLRFR